MQLRVVVKIKDALPQVSGDVQAGNGLLHPLKVCDVLLFGERFILELELLDQDRNKKTVTTVQIVVDLDVDLMFVPW